MAYSAPCVAIPPARDLYRDPLCIGRDGKLDLLAVLDTIKKISDNIYWGNMG